MYLLAHYYYDKKELIIINWLQQHSGWSYFFSL